MKHSMIAAALAVGLLTTPALAQQSGAEHDAHHSGAAGSATAGGGGSNGSGGGMPNMQGKMQDMMQARGMMGGMMQGQGMMQCPMMQGGMANMMGGQMASTPQGDQSVGSLALGAINQRMHREMMIEFTGDVDADFARGMIAHHRGAIDMAKVVAAFGDDPEIRELAQNVITAQEAEIEMMERWLEKNAGK